MHKFHTTQCRYLGDNQWKCPPDFADGAPPNGDPLSDTTVLKVVEFGLSEAHAAGYVNMGMIAGSVMIALDGAGLKVARTAKPAEQGNMRPESPLELAEEMASCAKSDTLRFSEARTSPSVVPEQAIVMAETITGERYRITVTRVRA